MIGDLCPPEISNFQKEHITFYERKHPATTLDLGTPMTSGKQLQLKS